MWSLKEPLCLGIWYLAQGYLSSALKVHHPCSWHTFRLFPIISVFRCFNFPAGQRTLLSQPFCYSYWCIIGIYIYIWIRWKILHFLCDSSVCIHNWTVLNCLGIWLLRPWTHISSSTPSPGRDVSRSIRWVTRCGSWLVQHTPFEQSYLMKDVICLY